MKIQIRVNDPKTREIWDSALQAKAEVDSWPSWKRDRDTVRSKDHVRMDLMRTSSTGLCVRTIETVLRRIQDRIELEETVNGFFEPVPDVDDVDPTSHQRLATLRELETELKLLMENPHA